MDSHYFNLLDESKLSHLKWIQSNLVSSLFFFFFVDWRTHNNSTPDWQAAGNPKSSSVAECAQWQSWPTRWVFLSPGNTSGVWTQTLFFWDPWLYQWSYHHPWCKAEEPFPFVVVNPNQSFFSIEIGSGFLTWVGKASNPLLLFYKGVQAHTWAPYFFFLFFLSFLFLCRCLRATSCLQIVVFLPSLCIVTSYLRATTSFWAIVFCHCVV